MPKVQDPVLEQAQREARFWAKVNKTETCWLWTGWKSEGYGRFFIGSRTDGTCRDILAHRFAYELLVGNIPKELQIDHLCRIRACVNPMHMEPVTQQVNILRGQGYSARAARVTHCPQGHPYDLLNTFIDKGRQGGRHCRICGRGYARAYYRRRRYSYDHVQATLATETS